MRCNGSVARLDVRRQVEGDGRRLLALLAVVIECQAHRVGVRHAALQRLTDRGLEFGGAIAVEQAQQGRGDGAEIVAAGGGAQQQGLARRCRLGEPVGAAMTACGPLVCDEGLDMGGILDLIALVVASAMAGEDSVPSTMRTTRGSASTVSRRPTLV
jgi:hypothetical protein